MAQNTSRNAGRYAIDLALGAGDLVVEKSKTFVEGVRKFSPREFARERAIRLIKAYDDLAERGDDLRTRVRRSQPVKLAAEQTRVARSQVKGASTSIRKAVGANVTAAKRSAQKVG